MLGIETIIGGAGLALLLLMVLVATNGWQNEKADAEYLRERLRDAREEWQHHIDERERSRKSYITLLGEASESKYLADSWKREAYKVAETLDEVEADLEEAEEDVDVAQALAEDAVKSAEKYDALLERILDFADRVIAGRGS